MRNWTAERGLERVVVGADGLAMLALSCVVIAASGGISLLAVLAHVLHVAVRTPSDRTGGNILVLGMQLGTDERPNTAFRARLDRAERLARGDERTIILLGGRTRAGAPTEAEAGRAYLVTRGIAAERIEVEDRSRHTLENLRLYRAAYAGRAVAMAQPPMLVTSRFHLARAAAMAADLGIPHSPCAAEERLIPSPATALALLNEAVLLHWYFAGRTFSRWTRNERMLARIT